METMISVPNRFFYAYAYLFYKWALIMIEQTKHFDFLGAIMGKCEYIEHWI